MTQRLPSLNALRAFEATARHRSFTHAAVELGVTHGAVSRQVAALEDRVQLKLFVRAQRGIELTAAGEKYFRTLRDAFDLILEGTLDLKPRSGKQELRLSVPPTFAMRWLVPRLVRFRARNHDIKVDIVTSHEPCNFLDRDIDAYIQSEACELVQVNYPAKIHVSRLFGEVLMPVCSPALLERHRVRCPRDLEQLPLLSSMHRPSDWPTWLTAAGVPDLDNDHGIGLENSALSYQAAINQAGVVVAQFAFIEDDILNGRLVEPFNIRATTPWSHFLVYPGDRPKPRPVELFERWILEEAARYQ